MATPPAACTRRRPFVLLLHLLLPPTDAVERIDV
jgi:hypothetical protein